MNGEVEMRKTPSASRTGEMGGTFIRGPDLSPKICMFSEMFGGGGVCGVCVCVEGGSSPCFPPSLGPLVEP